MCKKGGTGKHKRKTYTGVVLAFPRAGETPVLPEIAGFKGFTVTMGGWTATALAAADCEPGVADDPEIVIEEFGKEATGVTATGLDATPVAAKGVPEATGVPALGVSDEATATGPWEAKPVSDCIPWLDSFWACSRAS